MSAEILVVLSVGMESSYEPSISEEISVMGRTVLVRNGIPATGSLCRRSVPLSSIYAGRRVVALEVIVLPVLSPSLGVAEQVISSSGASPKNEFCGSIKELLWLIRDPNTNH